MFSHLQFVTQHHKQLKIHLHRHSSFFSKLCISGWAVYGRAVQQGKKGIFLQSEMEPSQNPEEWVVLKKSVYLLILFFLRGKKKSESVNAHAHAVNLIKYLPKSHFNLSYLRRSFVRAYCSDWGSLLLCWKLSWFDFLLVWQLLSLFRLGQAWSPGPPSPLACAPGNLTTRLHFSQN